jgi:hypothetical protein
MQESNVLEFANLVTAVVLAALTGVYVFQTRRLVCAQTYPNVIVYTDHENDRATIIQIVIKNVGFAVAKEVSFSLSRPIPARAFGFEGDSAEPAQPMDSGPLINGIPALGPGSERRIDWGQYGGLKRALGDELVFVTCKFVHGTKILPPTHHILEVESYAGTNASPSEAARVARSLEEIQRKLQFGPIRVQVTEPPKPPPGSNAA